MANLSWGNPAIYYRKAGTTGPFKKLPDCAKGTVTADTTKGEKTEAKTEADKNDDVRYGANGYALNATVRAKKGRKKPFKEKHGIILDEYEVYLQPEDPECLGFYMPLTRVSIADAFSAANGGDWPYTFDALDPGEGKEDFEWGYVTVGDNNDISFVPVEYDED